MFREPSFVTRCVGTVVCGLIAATSAAAQGKAPTPQLVVVAATVSHESGLAAALFGPVAAVVAGGIGTVLVVLIVARVWPEMVALKKLTPEGPVHDSV